MKYLKTVTIRFFSDAPVSPATPLSRIAYMVGTHAWPADPTNPIELRSRAATRDERTAAAALAIPLGADDPEREDPAAGVAGNVGELEDHFDDSGAPINTRA